MYILAIVFGSIIFFLGPIATTILSIMDFIKYLKCTDEESEQIYIIGRKELF